MKTMTAYLILQQHMHLLCAVKERCLHISCIHAHRASFFIEALEDTPICPDQGQWVVQRPRVQACVSGSDHSNLFADAFINAAISGGTVQYVILSLSKITLY